jgi:predicted phage gp36 major capsid-like protein
MPRSIRFGLFMLAALGSLSVVTAAPVQAQSAAERRDAVEMRKHEKQDRLHEAEEKDKAARAAAKRKKDEYGKQADAQKLHLLKRRSFMKKCIAG